MTNRLREMPPQPQEWQGAAERGYRYRPEDVPSDFLAAEIFGYPPEAETEAAEAARAACACPFKGGRCTKLDGPAGTGICSIRYKAAGFQGPLTWAVCANRLSGGPFASVLDHHFGRHAADAELVTEVQIPEPKMSFDAVGLLQTGEEDAEFVGIEAQTIDTRGGSLRPAWAAYVEGSPGGWRKRYSEASPRPKTMPGVNTTNVWKRLLPQVMNKGRMYAEWDSTLYVLLQSNVFEFVRNRMPLRELSRQERDRAEIVWMPWDYTGDADEETGMLRSEIGSPVYTTVAQVEQAFVKVAATQRPVFLATVISKLQRSARARMRGIERKARDEAASRQQSDGPQ
jgi:Restriction endonuclease NotI